MFEIAGVSEEVAEKLCVLQCTNYLANAKSFSRAELEGGDNS